MPRPRPAATVVIRPAIEADALPLARLAALDSCALPAGELIVAEVDGEVVAALSLDSGERVANPFYSTADVLALLSLRGTRLRAA